MVSFAQSIRPIEEKDFITEDRVGKFYLIPEAGLWFGNYTNVEIAPQIAYHITDRISLGAGPHYIFYQNNDYYSPINFSSHIFGFKAFSRLSVIRDASEILPIYLFDELFAHVEFETMTMENKYFNAPTFPDEGRFWNDYLYIGAGISQKYSQRSSYFVLLLWNLNDSFNSLYQNPTYRVGISVNLK
jgi:hypothetical protein